MWITRGRSRQTSARKLSSTPSTTFAAGGPRQSKAALTSSARCFTTDYPLSEKSKVSRQAISKHLVVLSDVGLVRSTRRGRERVWDLAPERLSDAHEYLSRISRMWDRAIDRLRAFVETDEE